jgi:beta-lactam-binding protein with PASTA domain
VPFVTGQTQAAALATLRNAGFQMFTEADLCHGQAHGAVSTVTPKRQVPGQSVMVCLGDGTTVPTQPLIPPITPPGGNQRQNQGNATSAGTGANGTGNTGNGNNAVTGNGLNGNGANAANGAPVPANNGG